MIQRLPGLISSDSRGVGLLQGDQHDVVGAVRIEPALHLEVPHPPLTGGELSDARLEFFEQSGVITHLGSP